MGGEEVELVVTVSGKPGESVTLGYFDAATASPLPLYHTCEVTDTGAVAMHLAEAKCAPSE